jgi:hypothetical protein
LLAWHRKLIAEKYNGRAKRGPGRPRTATELEDLVVRLAQENRDWGYRRLLGAMSNLGHSLAVRGGTPEIRWRHLRVLCRRMAASRRWQGPGMS